MMKATPTSSNIIRKRYLKITNPLNRGIVNTIKRKSQYGYDYPRCNRRVTFANPPFKVVEESAQDGIKRKSLNFNEKTKAQRASRIPQLVKKKPSPKKLMKRISMPSTMEVKNESFVTKRRSLTTPMKALKKKDQSCEKIGILRGVKLNRRFELLMNHMEHNKK
jgi:hypothetical protein